MENNRDIELLHTLMQLRISANELNLHKEVELISGIIEQILNAYKR